MRPAQASHILALRHLLDMAAAAAKTKSPQDRLKDLQSPDDPLLISQFDIEAGKHRVLSEMTP